MTCCFINSKTVLETPADAVESNYKRSAHQERDARLTGLVLGFLALFLFAAAFTLFGVGTLSPTTLNGLGMFPYLGGAFCGFLGLGILTGCFVFGAIASVRSCEKNQWKNRL